MSLLLIQFSHLFKSFGACKIFDDISLSINEGEAFALIGENGSGKTTLLRLLIGVIQPDTGHFNRAPYLTIGFLPQEIHFSDPHIITKDFIEQSTLSNLEKRMAECLEDPDRLPEWAELHEEYEQLGGYRRPPLEKVFNGLKLETAILDMPLATLSSGQRVRAALAKALLEGPDLLLLDEPTNHLDHEMQGWLQEALAIRQA